MSRYWNAGQPAALDRDVIVKPTSAQLFKKFPEFSETGRFIAMVTRTRPVAKSDESKPQLPTLSLRSSTDGTGQWFANCTSGGGAQRNTSTRLVKTFNDGLYLTVFLNK
jgi:hypothetical protein